MNKIEFSLMANDSLTPALTLASVALRRVDGDVRKLDGAMDRLNNSARSMDNLHGKLKGIGSSLMMLGTGAVLGGIAAATAALFGLNNAIQKAGKEETQTLMTVSDIANGLGLGFNQATKEVEYMKGKIAEMAAPLPGTTAAYTDFFQAVGGGLSRHFKGNVEGFKEAAEDITKRAGVLGAIWNISGTESGSVFDRLINGSSGFQEIAQNDVIQRNSSFKAALMDEMKKMGVEANDWKKQSTDTRLKIVRAALKTATPDELINRFNGTFESVTQGLETYWFNPQSGVFGVMRKVITDKGTLTALEAVTSTLSAAISLGQAVNGLAVSKGFSLDPMKLLITFLSDVTQLLNGVEYFVRSGGKLPTFNFNLDIVGGIRKLAENVPNALSGIFQGANSFLGKVDLAETGTWLGEVFNSVSLLLTNIFTKADWVAIGETVGRFIGSSIRGLINFLAKVNYAQVGAAIGGFVQAVALFGVGILKGIVVDFGEGIGKYLSDIWSNVKSQFARCIEALRNMIDRVLGFFSSLNPLKPASSTPVTPVQGALNAISGAGMLGSPVAGIASLAGKALEASGVQLPKAASELLGIPQAPPAKPLATPMAANSQKVAYNTYNPSVNITAPNAESLGSSTLEALAAQYATFRTQMA